MNISRRSWLIFLTLAAIGLAIWFRFSFPQLAFINLSINRVQALKISKDYLKERGASPQEFQTAIVFQMDSGANRYLQKTVKFDGLKKFVKEHDFDLFYWSIRFFKEKQKEEYYVSVEPARGQIIGFSHTIDENEYRPEITKDEARIRAQEFLTRHFNFNLEDYDIRGDLGTVRDNRSDFSFSWSKRSVSIPWSEEENSGTAKLLMSATITGDEILSFRKNSFDVPDQFNRYLSSNQNIALNILTVINLLSFILFAASIFFIFTRRNHLAMHTSKNFYIGVMIFFSVLMILGFINYYQLFLSGYPTTLPFADHLGRALVDLTQTALFSTVAIILPGLAGELLRYEVNKDHKVGSFLYYLQTTFLSSTVARQILLGYLVVAIMLGVQSLLVKIGQDYWGVWTEHTWMVQMTTAYVPFLAALTVGLQASFSEEVMYRFFGITWGQKVFKNTIVAVVFVSLIWGFSHSTYPVYPMWFRGIEVTITGIFLSFVYLRYGLITVLVAHYLFNVFWHTADFLFGHTQPVYVYSSLAVLLLPIAVAAAAFIMNKSVEPKPLRWHLTKKQLYNLNILKYYLRHHPEVLANKTKEELAKEIAHNGWDLAVAEVAVEETI